MSSVLHSSPQIMRILVVDDEREFGVLLSRLLERLGHDPVLALDPVEALEMLDSDIAGVITDIDMPGMSGVELAREIRDRVGPIPIVFCTGSDLDSDVVSDASEIGSVWPKAKSIGAVRELIAEFVATFVPPSG